MPPSAPDPRMLATITKSPVLRPPNAPQGELSTDLGIPYEIRQPEVSILPLEATNENILRVVEPQIPLLFNAPLARALGADSRRILHYEKRPRRIQRETHGGSSLTRLLESLSISSDSGSDSGEDDEDQNHKDEEDQDNEDPDNEVEDQDIESPRGRSRFRTQFQTHIRFPSLDTPLVDLLGLGLSLGNEGTSRSLATQSANPPRPIKEIEYLFAFGLASNFYYNLVSWNSQDGRLVVGVDKEVFWWDDQGNLEQIDYDPDYLSTITSVECSPSGEVAIATADGTLYVQNAQGRIFSHRFPFALKCIRWMANTKFFIAGDAQGFVYFGQIRAIGIFVLLEISVTDQQVCGLALSTDNTELAVGSNDNCATIWDIRNLVYPVKKFVLSHTAAVKGMLYCPWAPSLLATGGGCKDQHLRFWHTRTGCLLSEHDLGGQITSVCWSETRKELAVTFGFLPVPMLLNVYSFPEMRLVAAVSSEQNLRGLSAAVLPDQTKVALAVDDFTVRIFRLWSRRPHRLTNSPGYQGVGAYGSAVIESAEGIDIARLTLR